MKLERVETMKKILVEVVEDGEQWQGRVMIIVGANEHEIAFRSYPCKTPEKALQITLCWAEDNASRLLKWP